MGKLSAIIKREYFTRVRSKGFAIGTLLTPLMLASILLLPALLIGGTWGSNYRVIVLDQTKDIALYQRVEKTLVAENDTPGRFELHHEPVNEETQREIRKKELNKAISENQLDAYVVVPATVLDQGKISYHGKDAGDFVAEMRIENAFNTAVIEQRMINSGANAAQAGQLSKKIEMETFNERRGG